MSDINAAAKEFVRWAVREGAWNFTGLDGGSIQDKAESLGLLVKVAYDPAVHGIDGDAADAEPGDDWYMFHDELKESAA